MEANAIANAANAVESSARTDRASEIVVDQDLVSSFRDSLEQLVRYGADEGVKLKAYLSPDLGKFSALPFEQASRIAAATSDYILTLSTIKNQNEHLRYNLNTVWLTLRRTGMRPDGRLFQILDQNDIVEVYTLEGVQVFRSFHFFQYSSYDLETIFCTPWYELYERSAEFDAAYMELFGRVVTGQVKESCFMEVPAHSVVERAAAKRRSTLEPRIVGPLTDSSGKLTGYVHTVRVINNDL